MVKKMEPHMTRDLEQEREVFEKLAGSCREAYEKFESQVFEEEEYSMSKKLVLGLDYMDSTEYFLFLVDDLSEFSKAAMFNKLLIYDYRERSVFTEDGTKVWHNYSDCHGKPINHDRFWVLRELLAGNLDEATLIAKIKDFGERVNGHINASRILITPISELDL